MKQIFTARNDMEAHFVNGLLEQEGIRGVLQGEPLEGAWGDLPLSARALPSIWVDEADVDRAGLIIENFQQREARRADEPADAPEPVSASRKCPKCGEDVEAQFDVCWNCGAELTATAG